MNSLAKKIESFANASIIIVAILLSVVLVKNYILAKPDDSAQIVNNSQVHAGAKLPLSDVDWVKNGQTLVLAISSTCHYCTESASFYQRLAQRQGNTKLVAVLPQRVSESQKYLDKLGISINKVIQASLDSIGVRGTPTLLLVNEAGVVTDVWVGKLPEEQEAAVISQLQTNRN